jgi:hypothetical protein
VENSTVMDADEVRARFADRGVVRVDGAFSAEQAAAIRDVLWQYAGRRIGVRPDEPSTWPATGWMPMSWKGVKRRSALSAVTDNDAVGAALDAIFGDAGWETTGSGPQVLFTLPTEGPWKLPTGWHMDCGFELPTWPVYAVKLFAFAGAVEPFGGGTLLLPGIHTLVDRYRTESADARGGDTQSWGRFLRGHAPLGELLDAAQRPDYGRSLVGQRYEVDGVQVDVSELTGAPGDVVITHLHVFHVGSPNTTRQPRVMLGQGVRRVSSPT